MYTCLSGNTERPFLSTKIRSGCSLLLRRNARNHDGQFEDYTTSAGEMKEVATLRRKLKVLRMATYLDNICPSVLGLWRMGLQVLFGIRSGIHQIGSHIWPWLGRSRSFLAHIKPGH